ncbi:membrane-associated tyrosine- and threonine-specific cdc2-inhibitory kinase [Macrosteles quadrilineatus]|uniref:membrane-associated tyrosine- and threonine-specific cdc2-inhibitory kinase n=1 Tax=Macrosteles quadrilineatus TaxID=74068 RepID=UPI0023E17780|nr:membrane-associated tyrosine- and threonine-specific cdc2-inhibitory kinase [Macrosteles quadrilineatus]
MKGQVEVSSMSGVVGVKMAIYFEASRACQVHSFKDIPGQKDAIVFPPKVKGKHFSNPDQLLDGQFNPLTPCFQYSLIYNGKSRDNYFEQCYSACEMLGEGSYAKVIRVTDRTSGLAYALKITKEPFRNKFDRTVKLIEINHHWKIQHHPNIVTLFKAWEEDRFLFSLQELCKPLNLDSSLAEATCWLVLVDILQALKYINAHQLGHFDVKPANIVLGCDGLYKLTDFGNMIKLENEDEIHKEGDAKYVAPELVQGGIGNFTSKADIFSLGISILEMASNTALPKYGPVWEGLRGELIPYAETAELSVVFINIMIKMITKDHRQRPSAAVLLDLPEIKQMAEKRAETLSGPVLSDAESNASVICWPGTQTVDLIHRVQTESNKVDVVEINSSSDSPDSTVTIADRWACRRPLRVKRKRGRTSYGYQDLSESTPDQERISSTNVSMSTSEGDGNNSTPNIDAPSSSNLTLSPTSHSELDQPGLSSRQLVRSCDTYCPSKSLLAFGISPVRLSEEAKRSYLKTKSQKRMKPRNLLLSFESSSDE